MKKAVEDSPENSSVNVTNVTAGVATGTPLYSLVNGAKTPDKRKDEFVTDHATAGRTEHWTTRRASVSRTAPTSSVLLPGTEQTPDSIRRWMERHAAKGSVVAVRHARWQLYEYHLDEVIKLKPRSRRIQLAQHGTFDLTGESGPGPKGCLTLLIPTPEVLDAAAQGRTWQHGKPAFKRPLSAHEQALVARLRARQNCSQD